jgi:hypothetical protein
MSISGAMLSPVIIVDGLTRLAVHCESKESEDSVVLIYE